MVKIFIYILRLKEIPKLYWSSPFEYNLKPKKITIFYLNNYTRYYETKIVTGKKINKTFCIKMKKDIV